MKISEHYGEYPRKTLIVVTNNELAKIYSAHERDVEELDLIKMEFDKPNERRGTGPNSGGTEDDTLQHQNRVLLYHSLSDRLLNLIKEGYEDIILCAPEVLKNEIDEHIHTDVKGSVKELVAKNLASLPLDQVIRILQETR